MFLYYFVHVGVRVQFYSIYTPNCLALSVERTFLFPLNYFGTFLENKIVVSLEISEFPNFILFQDCLSNLDPFLDLPNPETLSIQIHFRINMSVSTTKKLEISLALH